MTFLFFTTILSKKNFLYNLSLTIVFAIILLFFSTPISAIIDTLQPKVIKEYTLDERISKEFEAFVNGIHIDPYQEYHKYYIISGKKLETLLPNEIKNEIKLMDAGGADLIIIHNFPIDSFIPQTPRDSKKPPSKLDKTQNFINAKGFISEAAILGLGYLLNAEPFYKKEEKDGKIINQIIPIKDEKYKNQRSSYGSRLELLPHTENVYQVPPLKYFSLVCLRGDPKVSTSIIFLDDIVHCLEKYFPDKVKKILNLMEKPLFKMSSGPGHHSTSASILPIIEHTKEGEIIFRLNLNPGRTIGITHEAEEVVTLLREMITSQEFRKTYYKRIHLSAGDLILFKNWKVMHSRDKFEIDPSHWRWLQRCYFR